MLDGARGLGEGRGLRERENDMMPKLLGHALVMPVDGGEGLLHRRPLHPRGPERERRVVPALDELWSSLYHLRAGNACDKPASARERDRRGRRGTVGEGEVAFELPGRVY